MARSLKVELEGWLYHLIARGVYLRNVFHSRDGHERSLSTLAEPAQLIEQLDRQPSIRFGHNAIKNRQRNISFDLACDRAIQ
jgi:hypothetical protein